MFGDEGEFLVQQLAHLIGDMRAVAGVGGAERQFLQPLLRGPAFGHGFVRIFIAQLVERETDAAQKSSGLRHRVGTGAVQARDFRGIVEMTFGIGLQPPPRLPDRGAGAYAGQHVLKRALRGVGIERVHGGEQRPPGPVRQALEAGQPPRVAAVATQRRAQPYAPRRQSRQPAQQGGQVGRTGGRDKAEMAMLHQLPRRAIGKVIVHRIAMDLLLGRGGGGQHDQQQVIKIGSQIFIVENAAALDRTQIADRQQFGEFAPPPPGRGIGDNVGRPVGKDEPRADDEAQVDVAGGLFVSAEVERQASLRLCLQQRGAGALLCLFAGDMGAHHARHRIAIGNADARQSKLHRAGDHVGRMGRAAQEGEVGCGDQFGEGGRRIAWRGERWGRRRRRAGVLVLHARGLQRVPFAPVDGFWPGGIGIAASFAPRAHANRP